MRIRRLTLAFNKKESWDEHFPAIRKSIPYLRKKSEREGKQIPNSYAEYFFVFADELSTQELVRGFPSGVSTLFEDLPEIPKTFYASLFVWLKFLKDRKIPECSSFTYNGRSVRKVFPPFPNGFLCERVQFQKSPHLMVFEKETIVCAQPFGDILGEQRLAMCLAPAISQNSLYVMGQIKFS